MALVRSPGGFPFPDAPATISGSDIYVRELTRGTTCRPERRAAFAQSGMGLAVELGVCKSLRVSWGLMPLHLFRLIITRRDNDSSAGDGERDMHMALYWVSEVRGIRLVIRRQ